MVPIKMNRGILISEKLLACSHITKILCVVALTGPRVRLRPIEATTHMAYAIGIPSTDSESIRRMPRYPT